MLAIMDAPENSTKHPIYFYHSFPRRQDHAVGLRILDSILEKGLLLTAELRTFPGHNLLNTCKFIQKRVCFTALPIDGLARHAQTFGHFSLEFEVAALRDFGALPAVYFSGLFPDGKIFGGAGDMLVRYLLEAHEVLGRLWRLRDHGDDQEKSLADAVLGKINPCGILIQELYFTLQALLNLYYPTDDPRWTDLMHYYLQNEWKIVPNLAFKHTWHFLPLSPEQRAELLEMDEAFFGSDILGQPRVDHCSLLNTVGGMGIVDLTRRVIVPDESVEDARRIVVQRNRNIPVVAASEASQ